MLEGFVCIVSMYAYLPVVVAMRMQPSTSISAVGVLGRLSGCKLTEDLMQTLLKVSHLHNNNGYCHQAT